MNAITVIGNETRRSTTSCGRQRHVIPAVLCTAALVTLAWAGIGHAQGCGGMMGSHGGGHAMTHEATESPQTVAPIWTNMMHSYLGMQRAVSMMSSSDAQYYGGLLRDDFRSLTKTGKAIYPDVEEPLKASAGRVKQLTRQLQDKVKAHDSVAAATELARLDIEIGRVATLFPAAALPAATTSTEETSTTSAKSPSFGPSATDRRAVYVCPMHPEVRMNAPGDCPKCGMALKEIDG